MATKMSVLFPFPFLVALISIVFMDNAILARPT
jgi:hypothetical protein